MNVTLNITTDSLDDAIATLSAIKAGLGFGPQQVAAGALHPSEGATSSQSAALDAELMQGVHSPETAPTNVEIGTQDDVALVDKRGMPWDARIHASTKSKTVDGNWKNKRGVDGAVRATVEAELLGTPAAAEADVAIDNTATPPPPVAATPPPPTPAAQPQQAATPPPPVAATAGAGAVETFPQLMHFIQSKGLTPAEYLPRLQAFGLAALPDLLKPENAGVIPQLHAALAQLPQAST